MSEFPANETNDLEIKKRARRRLVGAAALALLAVIVLPLAMDGEAPPPVPDMQVSIPERGETPPDGADAGAVPGTESIDIEPDVDPGASPPPLPGAALSGSQLPASPDAASATPPSGAPGAAPASSAGSPESAPAGGKPAAKDAEDAEAARALALLSGAAPDNRGASPDKTGKFFVQVAAFNDAVKAVALASELKQQGYPVYTVAGNKVTRVRVGPLSGRREGERIVAKLKAEGRNAVLSSSR
ncbi:MAG: SPOR domain-containing protein [Azoarcus sp.]|nr:SPOR domain-containing protein [Azoarcus sp.]